MGIKPYHLTHKDGKKIRGDRAHTGNLMPLLEQLQAYKVTAYNTRHQRGRKLSVGGVITPILCAAGVNWTREGLLHQVGWTSSFARPTSSLSTRSWMGDSNSSSPTPLAGLSKLLLPNPELTTKKRSSSIELRIELRLKLKMECRNADLGEPECYYFEEYEAPRMNPSVVAAHKRIGLLQKFNKWQGKAMEKMQKSMDKMVSKIKSLEKKVSGSSSKKRRHPRPHFP
ncbi:unnamed protein product [Microthlaspi erraticum]|uniref:Arabidopsis retrotransposon Orf1 C-terminal domain-containing protein n=1 Tax=Microthlaspi erraticum TaxID=1685480 RepID=A0A6D2JIH3_9BRAS|nr:unnamed protein product [Microthlaspi erraticum]